MNITVKNVPSQILIFKIGSRSQRRTKNPESGSLGTLFFPVVGIRFFSPAPDHLKKPGSGSKKRLLVKQT